MHSLFLLPPTLLALLLTSPVLFGHSSHYVAYAEPTSNNDQFREIAIHNPPVGADAPVCCLKPLEPLEPVEEDILLSFEEWKARQLHDTNTSGRTASRMYPPQAADPDSNDLLAVVPSGDNQGAGSGAAGAEGTTSEDQQQQYLLSPHFRVPLTDRFNYASSDCSARVHGAHRSAKSPHALLDAKKDRYMLSPCFSRSPGERQYVVVELCDDIRIDTVQLANFELFSGVFKEFSVSVAKTFVAGDGEGWVPVATYRAKNVRGLQSFHPPTSLRDFYRFIRIDFHSHYGNEYYCPVSLLRVYGLTHLEVYKWDLWIVEAEQREKMQRAAAADAQGRLAVDAAPSPPTESSPEIRGEVDTVSKTEDRPEAPMGTPEPAEEQFVSVEALADAASSGKTDMLTSFMDALESGLPSLSDIRAEMQPTAASYPSITEEPSPVVPTSSDGLSTPMVVVTTGAEGDVSSVHARSQGASSSASSIASAAERLASGAEQAAPESSATAVISAQVTSASDSTSTAVTTSDDFTTSTGVGASTALPQGSQTIFSVSSGPSSSSGFATNSIPHPPPVFGDGGESIYRTIMNRLSALEGNHSLYARYVEEQTAGVREALRRLGEEMGRLEGLGKMQAQMYQRSVREWERQRLRLEMEHGELLQRVNYLADEIVLEKRLGLAQLCLLLAVLVFMGLTRGSRAADADAYRRIPYPNPKTPSRSSSVREWGRRKLSLGGLNHTFGAPGDWIRLSSRTPSMDGADEVAKPRPVVDFELGKDKLALPARANPDGNGSEHTLNAVDAGRSTGSSTADPTHPPTLPRAQPSTNAAAHHSSPTLGLSSSLAVNNTPAYIHLAEESYDTARTSYAGTVPSASKRSGSIFRTPIRNHGHHGHVHSKHLHVHGIHGAQHRGADVWSSGLVRPQLVRANSSASASGSNAARPYYQPHPLQASASAGPGPIWGDRSVTGSAFVPRSAKKWARTAHLHEVKRVRPGSTGRRERERDRDAESKAKGKERDKENDGEDVFGPTSVSQERNGFPGNLSGLAKEKEKRKVRVVSANISEGDVGVETDGWIDTDTDIDPGDANGEPGAEVTKPGSRTSSL